MTNRTFDLHVVQTHIPMYTSPNYKRFPRVVGEIFISSCSSYDNNIMSCFVCHDSSKEFNYHVSADRSYVQLTVIIREIKFSKAR